MQTVHHRRKTSVPRVVWLLAVLVALAALTAGWLLLRREAPVPEVPEDTAVTFSAREPGEVASLTVALRNGEGWSAEQTTPGVLTLLGEPSFDAAPRYAEDILDAASTVICEAALTDDPAVYREHLADFGLDNPRLTARIVYRDGEALSFRVGDAVPDEDVSWLYMTVDGDDRLLAIDRGTAELLCVERSQLYPIVQPTLHQARFDRITLTGPGDAVIGAWELNGQIGDADAADRWRLTAPVRYPADAQALSALRANLANLRLGAYVGPATPENLTAYGFDAPRLTVVIHQAAGAIGTTGADGAYTQTDWPEDTFTLIVGGAKNQDVDYVRWGDGLYITSHYALAVFMNLDYASTLSRYLIPTALGNLASLTVETPEGTDVYAITRTERVAENNELVTDENGDVVYDVALTRNGKPADYDAFAATYAQLLTATVSGTLPDGWSTDATPHTVFTFLDVSGETRVLALTDFDALHDAVLLDGEAVFYLVKGGLTLN